MDTPTKKRFEEIEVRLEDIKGRLHDLEAFLKQPKVPEPPEPENEKPE